MMRKRVYHSCLVRTTYIFLPFSTINGAVVKTFEMVNFGHFFGLFCSGIDLTRVVHTFSTHMLYIYLPTKFHK